MEWVDINIKKPEVGEKVWTYFSHFDEVGIGTTEIDDYYPSFVASFHSEALL